MGLCWNALGLDGPCRRASGFRSVRSPVDGPLVVRSNRARAPGEERPLNDWDRRSRYLRGQVTVRDAPMAVLGGGFVVAVVVVVVTVMGVVMMMTERLVK